jgi:hypothetical protein
MNERSQQGSAGQCEVALASRKSTLKGLPDGLSQPTKRPEDPALLEGAVGRVRPRPEAGAAHRSLNSMAVDMAVVRVSREVEVRPCHHIDNCCYSASVRSFLEAAGILVLRTHGVAQGRSRPCSRLARSKNAKSGAVDKAGVSQFDSRAQRLRAI